MGNANGKIRNDARQTVTVLSYNNADKVYAVNYDSYTINPGETKLVQAGADAWGLKVKVRSDDEQYSTPFFIRNGEEHAISEILPLHTFTLKNPTKETVQFEVRDRTNEPTTKNVGAEAAETMTNLMRGSVAVRVLIDGVELSSIRSHSNGTVSWNGQNLVEGTAHTVFERPPSTATERQPSPRPPSTAPEPHPSSRSRATHDWHIAASEVDLEPNPFACGSFGRVFRASYMGSTVIVKQISAVVMRAFLKEVTLWHSLRHPNVVAFYGANSRDEPYFIVAQYAANGSLTNYLRQQRADPKARVNTWRMLKDVAAGLLHLHKKGIVHGDLRGANIVVGANGDAMVTDFGMSFYDDGTMSLQSEGLGAMGWRAPEFATLSTARPTSMADVYSLGMVCIEAFTLDNPWGRRDNQFIKDELLKGHVLVTRPDEMTDEQWELVSRMIHPASHNRPAMQEIIPALQRFATAEETTGNWTS